MLSDRTRKRRGFTLLEIMIVVLIIGILAAIAVGVFTKARENARRWACIANMKKIDAAKWEWAMENNKSALDTPEEDDVLPYLRSEEIPFCPSGGDTYVLNAVGEMTVCPNVADFPNHQQP